MTSLKDIRICVVYGGTSNERLVSIKTGTAVTKALQQNGYNVLPLDLMTNNLNCILDLDPDVVFNALHGEIGEDGVLQSFLEKHSIVCTGSDSKASRIAFNKYKAKELFKFNGIPTADFIVLEKGSYPTFYPCVVKPFSSGSTIGISIVNNANEIDKAYIEALKYDNNILAEKYISGKELTVSILNGELLPPIWIKPKNVFFDYDAKYNSKQTEYIFDLELTDLEINEINKVALKAYSVLGCAGASRVDIMYDGATPYVLEVNTVPGMTETSLLPKACEKKGIDFLSLILTIIINAFEKSKIFDLNR